MCHICGKPNWYSCNCIQQVLQPCNPCTTPNTLGCPILLDTACVIYHKNNNTLSLLTGLGLSNGATLQLILETIDTKIQQINVPDWSLPFLDDTFVINTLQQFGTSVDITLKDLQDQITATNEVIEDMGYLGEVIVDIAVVDMENGQYFFNTVSDLLKMKLNGSLRIITIT